MEAWRSAYNGGGFEKVDVSAQLAYVMAPKEEAELATIKKACSVTSDVFNKFLKEQLMEIIDSDKVGVASRDLARTCPVCLLDRQFP